jgi:hypothetical protein
MTRSFEDALGLPHLDDLLKEDGTLERRPNPLYDTPEAEFEETPATPQLSAGAVEKMQMAQRQLDIVEGKDHADKMDAIHRESLKHAQDIMDLGFNIDHARAARMFEVGAAMYKVAMDAANSKRDAQMKAMQLVLNQQKLELEKQAMGNVEAQPTGSMDAQAVMIEDRNEIIKRLREK